MTSNETNNIKVDTPNNNQKFPMFVKYVISNNNAECDVFLGRATNIFGNKYKFDMSTYNAKDNIMWHYLIDKNQYNINDNSYNIIKIPEYGDDMTPTTINVDSFEYDNYGFWVDKEKKMIETIML